MLGQYPSAGPPTYQIIKVPNTNLMNVMKTSLTIIPNVSSGAPSSLLEFFQAYPFLLLLVGFDTLTYRKDYDRSPTLVGHQDSFLAPLPGSVALLVSGTW